MTLDLARIGSPPALTVPAAGRDDGAAARVPHAENVTVSDAAREASRALGPAPRGSVLWYRAACLPRAAPPLASGAPAGRPQHLAVAAYRRAMERAAA